MPIHYQTIPISASFWKTAAKDFLISNATLNIDFSGVRVVVPTFEHAHLFLLALSHEIHVQKKLLTNEVEQDAFIPPRIQTMFAWMGMQTPHEQASSAASERLMTLYGELRQHAWLKNLFGAKRNTDLLPLAQTLLTLSDELTQVWLPQAIEHQDDVKKTWQAALATLPTPVQKMCSDETQLVWTIWQSQLDGRDKIGQTFSTMMQVAKNAKEPLVWIAPTMPSVFENAFLQAYQQQQKVVCISIDWRSSALDTRLSLAWPELIGKESSEIAIEDISEFSANIDFSNLQIYAASSLEDEAEQAAQTIIEWLQNGKQRIAVIAQDRVVSRRLRALLERAHVHVADETGWKLSTTRAAACLAAWFEVISSRADTMALLDFIKSPFIVRDNKEDLLMQIEITLRQANVLGGWDAVLYALEGKDERSQAREWVVTIARVAHNYSGNAGRKTLKEWTASTLQVMLDLGLQNTLQEDLAGLQIVHMLQAVNLDCSKMEDSFSFSEWRALINMQMESTPFTVDHIDKRVVMLPLNGARLRHFDAVYVIGGDEKHLPSKAQETLFFTNAVRRECGLTTREERQQQQLRDFAEVVLSNAVVVLSWQSQTNGEFNAVSPWIEQVNLMLERQGLPVLKQVKRKITPQRLASHPIQQAMPKAAALLPDTLSASGLSSLIACPYQFFAGRMLKLSAIDELSDKPEKRDYGDWLHAILKTYHDQIQSENIQDFAEREIVLREISNALFARVLKKSPAALGYSVRWNKVIPAYLVWANAREQAGWKFVMGESWAEQALQWNVTETETETETGMQGQVLLRGRIDRVDQQTQENGDVLFAVLDYKTKALGPLKKRLKEAEDHQLAFYGLLSEQKADEASYVALELERDKIGDAQASQFAQWKIELEKAIKINMQSIQSNQSLPAQGVESVCQFCEMRGLCRKGAW
jgi:ATP-dependent helicase/nuclease subunit B